MEIELRRKAWCKIIFLNIFFEELFFSGIKGKLIMHCSVIPANKIHLPDGGLMVVNRLRHWPNIWWTRPVCREMP